MKHSLLQWWMKSLAGRMLAYKEKPMWCQYMPMPHTVKNQWQYNTQHKSFTYHQGSLFCCQSPSPPQHHPCVHPRLKPIVHYLSWKRKEPTTLRVCTSWNRPAICSSIKTIKEGDVYKHESTRELKFIHWNIMFLYFEKNFLIGNFFFLVATVRRH